MKRFAIIFLLLVVGIPLLLWAAPQQGQNSPAKTNTSPDSTKDSKKGELAWVSILNFFDDTKSSDFSYLAGSISDAIDVSMNKMFEYEKKVAKLPENFGKTIYNQADIQNLTNWNNLDIVIYGVYSYDSGQNEVVIATTIYLAYAKRFIELEAIRNKVDSTIFAATEIVAAQIVAKIRAIALEAKQTQEALDNSKTTILFSSKGDPQILKDQLDRLKAMLEKKYDGNFLSLDEYLQRSKSKKPSEKIALTKWLQQEGFRPSFELSEEDRQVTVKSIVNGEVKDTVSYKADAKPEEIEKSVSQAASSMGIPVKEATKKDSEKMSLKTDQLQEQAQKEQAQEFSFEQARSEIFFTSLFPNVVGSAATAGFEPKGGPEASLGYQRFWGSTFFGARLVHAAVEISRSETERFLMIPYYRIRVDMLNVDVFAGYRLLLSQRLQLAFAAGLGYYRGTVYYEIEAMPMEFYYEADTYFNSSLSIQISLLYRLFGGFSAGLHLGYSSYFDYNNQGNSDPIETVNIGLRMAYAF